jgi:hypothetical protein
MVFIGVKSTRTLNSYIYEPYYKRNIKDRELEMYRSFKHEMAAMRKTKPAAAQKYKTIREQLTQLN